MTIFVLCFQRYEFLHNEFPGKYDSGRSSCSITSSVSLSAPEFIAFSLASSSAKRIASLRDKFL